MKYYLHFSTTLLFSYLLYSLFIPKNLAIVLSILTAVFSSIPDLDFEIYTWANRNRMKLDNKKLLKYILYPYYLFLSFLTRVFKHRTTTHSILFPMLLFIIGRIIPLKGIRILFYIISLASIFHILEDLFTKSGIPLLYPLSKRNIAIPLINTKEDVFLQKIVFFLEILIYALII